MSGILCRKRPDPPPPRGMDTGAATTCHASATNHCPHGFSQTRHAAESAATLRPRDACAERPLQVPLRHTAAIASERAIVPRSAPRRRSRANGRPRARTPASAVAHDMPWQTAPEINWPQSRTTPGDCGLAWHDSGFGYQGSQVQILPIPPSIASCGIVCARSSRASPPAGSPYPPGGAPPRATRQVCWSRSDPAAR